MLEAYSVGVNLILNSNVETLLTRNIATLRKFDTAFKGATATAKLFDAEMKSLSASVPVINRLTRAMERLERAQAGLGGRSGSSNAMSGMVGDAQRLLGVTVQLSATMRTNAALAQQTAAAMQASAAAQGRASRAVAVPSAAAPANAAGFGGGRGYYAGAALERAGRPMVQASVSALERGMEVAHLRTTLLADQRVSAPMADQALDRAYQATMTAPGTTIAQNMRALIDLKNTIGIDDDGTIGTAQAMLPAFARMTALLQTIDRKRGGAGDQAGAAAKAMDIMGGLSEDYIDAEGRTRQRSNPELFQQRLDMMTRASVATNMRVSPADYLNFAKQARTAGMTLSDEFIYTKLPAIMDAMGGHRAGTALMGVQQVFEGGKMTDKSYDALAEVGLAGKAVISRVRDPNSRRIQNTRTEPGIYNLDLLRSDPVKYIESAQALMDAAGIKGTENQIIALMKASQRSTIAGFLGDLLKSQPDIEKARLNIVNTRPDVAQFFAANDPVAKVQQVQAAWDKLLATFGSAAMDEMIAVLDRTTAGLNSLASWARDNPGFSESAVAAGLGLGALAIGIGKIITAAAAFGAMPAIAGAAPAAGAAATGAAAAGAAAVALPLAVGVGAGIGGGILNYRTNRRLEADGNYEINPESGMLVPGPGYGSTRSVIAPNAARSPISTAPARISLQGDVNIDGRRAGSIIANGMAAEASGPSRGTTGPDLRINLGVQ